MDFTSQIQRLPRILDAGVAADLAAQFAGLPGAIGDLVAHSGSCAPYLAQVFTQQADWLAQALTLPPKDALDRLIGQMSVTSLRRDKARLAGLVALADLGGVFELDAVTRALSDFADRAMALALEHALGEAVARNQLESGAKLAVFAMGKWGAGELNYSSDIDLICLFDPEDRRPEAAQTLRAALVKVVRRVCALLSDVTAEGYVFRTDLRLRPDASVTPVCLSVDAALGYYESVGRTWERAAWIKARPAAGDAGLGDFVITSLQPFVWRRHLDFAAIADAHDIRQKIKDHKGLGARFGLEGFDLKLGSGGIRDIEFFTQTRQLIAGGRDHNLRLRDTQGALTALAQAGWVGGDEARALIDHYRAHRMIEHRLQMVRDAQTHALPSDDAGFLRLAAMCDLEVLDLRRDLSGRLDSVRRLTEGFFDPARPPETQRDARSAEIMARWRDYPAFRSERAIALFQHFEPQLMAEVAKSTDPDSTLLNFDRFLRSLPAGVQLFALFKANPNLVSLIVDICASSEILAAHLGQNAEVLDSVLDGDFFAPVPGRDALIAALARDLPEDYEQALVALRRRRADWHFRISVHVLRGLETPEAAGKAYATLAEAVLQVLLPRVRADVARRSGPEPGRGVALLGMGSLGVGWLTPASDLDLILIYDVAQTPDPDRMAPQAWYARLTQALVTALSAPMAGGKLYDSDMRLRPSGRKGPVATALSAFQSYQTSEAWTWEHLALTRARVVAGDADLGAAVEDFRAELLARPRDPEAIRRDIAEMVARLRGVRADSAEFDVKAGPGGLTEIDLVLAGAVLAREKPDQRAELAEIGQALQAFRTVSALLAKSPQSGGVILGAGPTRLLARALDPQLAANAKAISESLAGLRLRARQIVDSYCEGATAVPFG